MKYGFYAIFCIFASCTALAPTQNKNMAENSVKLQSVKTIDVIKNNSALQDSTIDLSEGSAEIVKPSNEFALKEHNVELQEQLFMRKEEIASLKQKIEFSQVATEDSTQTKQTNTKIVIEPKIANTNNDFIVKSEPKKNTHNNNLKTSNNNKPKKISMETSYKEEITRPEKISTHIHFREFQAQRISPENSETEVKVKKEWQPEVTKKNLQAKTTEPKKAKKNSQSKTVKKNLQPKKTEKQQEILVEKVSEKNNTSEIEFLDVDEKHNLRIISLPENKRRSAKNIVDFLATLNITAMHYLLGNYWVVDVINVPKFRSQESEYFLEKIQELEYEGKHQFKDAHYARKRHDSSQNINKS